MIPLYLIISPAAAIRCWANGSNSVPFKWDKDLDAQYCIFQSYRGAEYYNSFSQTQVNTMLGQSDRGVFFYCDTEYCNDPESTKQAVSSQSAQSTTTQATPEQSAEPIFASSAISSRARWFLILL